MSGRQSASCPRWHLQHLWVTFCVALLMSCWQGVLRETWLLAWITSSGKPKWKEALGEMRQKYLFQVCWATCLDECAIGFNVQKLTVSSPQLNTRIKLNISWQRAKEFQGASCKWTNLLDTISLQTLVINWLQQQEPNWRNKLFFFFLALLEVNCWNDLYLINTTVEFECLLSDNNLYSLCCKVFIWDQSISQPLWCCRSFQFSSETEYLGISAC